MTALWNLQLELEKAIDAMAERAPELARTAAQSALDSATSELRRQVEAKFAALEAAKTLGIASEALAGLITKEVVVVSEHTGSDTVGAARPGDPGFSIVLADRYGTPANFGQAHFDALRRGLSPGKYRLIAALVRAEDEATS